jgi:hypothetical protein
VGIVGGGTGSFAAFSYGVGYLAQKSYDAMLGIPGTTSSTASYIRTGALFFPRAVQYLVDALTGYTLMQVVIGGVIGLVVLISVVATGLGVSRWFVGHALPQALGLCCLYLGLIIGMALYLPFHVAPINQANLDLLFDNPPLSGAETSAVTSAAKLIHAQLRNQLGEVRLHRFFGLQIGATILVVYLALTLRRLRAGIMAGDLWSRYWLLGCDWLLRPLLYLQVVAVLVHIPSNYGVLGLSLRYKCVTIAAKTMKAPKEKPVIMDTTYSGILLSDLTAPDVDRVVLLSTTTGKGPPYVAHFVARDSIPSLKIERCNTENILAF